MTETQELAREASEQMDQFLAVKDLPQKCRFARKNWDAVPRYYEDLRSKIKEKMNKRQEEIADS